MSSSLSSVSAGPSAPPLCSGLLEDDLPLHVYRLHYCGSNSHTHPLSLPRACPPLASLALPREFALFASAASAAARWPAWERVAHWLLSLLYFPLAALFEERCRRLRCRELQRLHAAYDHAFLRDYRARALCNSLKFGCSPCCTVAFVDVLAADEDEARQLRMLTMGSPGVGSLGAGQHTPLPLPLPLPLTPDKEREKETWPVAPMVLLCVGDGSFKSPFCLDITDVLVKSQCQYFGAAWFSFVAHLNCYLRTVKSSDPLTIKASARCRPLSRGPRWDSRPSEWR